MSCEYNFSASYSFNSYTPFNFSLLTRMKNNTANEIVQKHYVNVGIELNNHIFTLTQAVLNMCGKQTSDPNYKIIIQNKMCLNITLL